MKLFEVMGVIGLDDAEAKRKLSSIDNNASDLSGRISKTGIAIGTAFGNIIAKGAMKLGEAVVNIGPSLVTAAAGAEALNAQFGQVFGDLEKNATDSMNAIAKETGILPNRLKGSFAQMAAFAKTTGASTADALSLTERATLAAADSAAFYDRSIEDVTESLQSFLKGNYENDAALGISATETTRNAKANELYGQSFKDLDEAQKQLTLLAMVEDGNKLSGALGQAARESDGLENVMGNLSQAWEDIKVKFGQPILEPAVAGIQKLTEWLMKVDTSKITDGLSRSVDWVKRTKQSIEEWIGSSGPQLESIKQIFENVFNRNVEVMTTLWNFVKDNLGPIFVGWFTWIQGHLPTIQATFTAVFNKVNQVANMVWAFFKNNILPILASFYGFIQSNMPTIQRIVEGVFKIIADVVKTVWSIFENLLLPVLKALWDWISPNIPKVQKIVEDAFSAIFKAVDAVVGVFESVTGAIKKAVDWLTSWNNKKVNKKTVEVEERRTGGGGAAFATGTNFAPGGMALVGERGPELVNLPRGSKVKTANQTRQLMGGDFNKLASAIMDLASRPVSVAIDGKEIVYATIGDIDRQLGSRANSQFRLMGMK